MKVICKEKKGKFQSPIVDWSFDVVMNLTPGKSYEVFGFTEKYYHIVDDIGVPQTCSKYLFKTTAELRNEKLDIILS